ncbi:hypothetical protein V6N11_012907 [Hibiscus sabdariffa]|uniref:Uncharacterized protein n=1 Tax=Hibiscus sabdariffa TaxID=183260 RepID=A0ABR2N987_9ROSI
MDQILNKVGSYWLGQKANKEINSVGDDLNSLSTSIEGGAKWLVNKIKGKMQKPLPELLKEYNLPIGIFPRAETRTRFPGMESASISFKGKRNGTEPKP